MSNSSLIDTNHSRIINSFKKEFFSKYGLETEVSIKPAATGIDNPYFDDADLVDLHTIINTFIPQHFKMQFKSVLYKTRKREIVELRMILMKIARDKGFTLTDIAEFTGKKHHTTIMYAVRTVNDLLATNPEFNILYRSIITVYNLTKSKNDAGTTESSDEIQTDSQPTNVTTLYSGEHSSSKSDPINDSRSIDLSKIRVDQPKQPTRAESYCYS